MSRNPTSTHKLNALRPVYCPLTSKLIVAEVSQMFDIPNGRFTWFHCESCGGWHLVIDNLSPEKSATPSNPTLNAPYCLGES